MILQAETKARNIVFDYALNDKNLPLDEFTKAYTNEYGSVSLYEYIDYLSVKRDSGLSAYTLDYYRKQLVVTKHYTHEDIELKLKALNITA